MNIEQIIEVYRKLRAKKSAIEQLVKEKLVPLNKRLEELENMGLKFLDDSGQTSAKTTHGTAYKSTLSTIKVSENSDFINFVTANDAFDLLPQKVVKAVYDQYIEDGISIPGVEVSSIVKLRIRKS